MREQAPSTSTVRRGSLLVGGIRVRAVRTCNGKVVLLGVHCLELRQRVCNLLVDQAKPRCDCSSFGGLVGEGRAGLEQGGTILVGLRRPAVDRIAVDMLSRGERGCRAAFGRHEQARNQRAPRCLLCGSILKETFVQRAPHTARRF